MEWNAFQLLKIGNGMGMQIFSNIPIPFSQSFLAFFTHLRHLLELFFFLKEEVETHLGALWNWFGFIHKQPSGFEEPCHDLAVNNTTNNTFTWNGNGMGMECIPAPQNWNEMECIPKLWARNGNGMHSCSPKLE